MNKRRPHHRRRADQPARPPRRRSSDHYSTIVQRLMLAGGAIGVTYGQAEMLGEPMRHIVTVAFVCVLVIVAVWMKET